MAIGWFRKKVKKNAELQDWSQTQILDLGKFLGLDLSQYDDGRLSEVTYFACLKVLSEAVAKLPLAIQRVTDTGGVEDAADSPFYKTVRVRPNPYMTPSSFWEAIENSRNHYGNAYALVIYERTGVSLYPLSSEHMTVRLPQDRRLHQAQDLLYDYVYPETGEQVRFPSESILHFKTSTTFGGILGLSVRDKLRLSLDGAMNSQMVLNELYKNNMTGKAVVQYAGQQEVNTELSRQFIRSMNDYAQGKNGTGKAFIPIPYGTTVTPLSLRLADEQFLELRKYTALQIASAFGIKPNQLNDYEKASYANSEAQQLAFYAETMLSILKQYEEELNYKLLTAEQIAKGYRFKFNVAAVLRGDTKAQVDSLCQGIANGLYTPNEARRMLDLPALEGGDRIYFNGSNVAVEDAGVQYQQQALSDSTEPSKALLKLAESIAKACDCGIMSLKGEDYSTRDEHGRFTGSVPHGGGSSGGSSGGGGEHPLAGAEIDSNEASEDTDLGNDGSIVSEKNYSFAPGVRPEIQQIFNAEYQAMTERFGTISTISMVEPMTWAGSGEYGNFNDNSGILSIRFADKKDGAKKLAQAAVENKQAEMWSSSHPNHVIRHEIGHAIQLEHARSDPLWGDKLVKINAVMNGISGKTVSLYASNNVSELISECIAESMTKKARSTAKNIVKILQGDD